MEKIQKDVCNKYKKIRNPHSDLGKMKYLIFQFGVVLFFAASLARAGEGPKYEKRGKRSPFIPYVTNEGQITNIRDEEESFALNLEGVIYDEGGQSMAIINGEILRKNDTVGDVKIIEIRKDSVVYIKDGEILIINVRREE